MDLSALINEQKAEFKDKHIVAFLGRVDSGKTVVSSLLFYHLRNHWIPGTKGKWECTTNSGHDAINEILQNMKDGKFAAATLKQAIPKLVIDLYRMEGRPIKFELILHDMSGENSVKLLSDEYADANDRLIDILTGDHSYLAFAEKYILLIDCSKKEYWDADISKISHTLRSLQKIKQIIHGYNDDEKLHTPLSIVFTKADRLDDVDSKKSARELSNEYVGLDSDLKLIHDKNSLSFFKVSIDAEFENIAQARLRAEIMKKEYEKQLKSKKATMHQQINTEIEQAVHIAKEQAISEGRSEQEIKQLCEDKKNQIFEERKNELEKELEQFDEEEQSIPIWHVSKSFNYTASEYDKLISWILDIKDDE